MSEAYNRGVEWIGTIPCHWQTSRIGQLYTERKEKVSDRDFAPLSVTMKGILPQLSTAAKTDAHDDRKLVRVGDFAINSRSDRRGSCGISPYDGSVSLINTVLIPRGEMHPRYYDWLFHSTMFSDEFYKWGHGIVDDLWTTNWQDMKRISVPVPPFAEQRRIADFLDRRCAEIDGVIEATKKTIEEYKALKQSIITEAVTGQCAIGNVQGAMGGKRRMKDSGIEWIGEIPEEWEVVRLKNLFDFGKGLPITKENLIESGIPVISYGQIHSKITTGVELQQHLYRYVDAAYVESNPQSLVHKGDLIFADTSEDLDGCGNAVYIDNELTLFAGYHTIVFSSKGEKNNKFLAYLFRTDAWRSQIRSKVSGVKVLSISRRILADATVVIPNIDEREAIVAYLDDKCKEINRIIERKQELLTEFEMYKKSVIYEYVTGKREGAIDAT